MELIREKWFNRRVECVLCLVRSPCEFGVTAKHSQLAFDGRDMETHGRGTLRFSVLELFLAAKEVLGFSELKARAKSAE